MGAKAQALLVSGKKIKSNTGYLGHPGGLGGYGADHEPLHHQFKYSWGPLLLVIPRFSLSSFPVISLLSVSNKGLKYPNNKILVTLFKEFQSV